MTKPSNIDWNGVELEYRAGIKSLAAIGSMFGVSDAGIIKRAKRDGWTRDLSARIKAATDAKLIEIAEQEQRAAVREQELAVSAKAVSEKKLVDEELTVDANANKRVQTVVKQAEKLARLSNLSDALTDELVHETANINLYEQLGELMHAPDEKGKDKLNEIYRKVINSGSRISSFRSLIESQKTLIGLQRQNVGLADNANGEADKPVETEMSEQETARRVAFLFASAIHKKEDTNGKSV